MGRMSETERPLRLCTVTANCVPSARALSSAQAPRKRGRGAGLCRAFWSRPLLASPCLFCRRPLGSGPGQALRSWSGETSSSWKHGGTAARQEWQARPDAAGGRAPERSRVASPSWRRVEWPGLADSLSRLGPHSFWLLISFALQANRILSQKLDSRRAPPEGLYILPSSISPSILSEGLW